MEIRWFESYNNKKVNKRIRNKVTKTKVKISKKKG